MRQLSASAFLETEACPPLVLTLFFDNAACDSQAFACPKSLFAAPTTQVNHENETKRSPQTRSAARKQTKHLLEFAC